MLFGKGTLKKLGEGLEGIFLMWIFYCIFLELHVAFIHTIQAFYSIVYFFLECHDLHPSEGTVIISLDQVSLQAGFQLES